MSPRIDSIPSPDDYPLDAYVNKRAVARRHRATLFGFAATVGLLSLIPIVFILDVRLSRTPRLTQFIMVAAIVPYAYTIMQAFLLKYALGENTFFSVLFAVCMAIPVVNMIVLLSANADAISLLRRAGLRVGFWGVSAKNYNRRFSPWLCHWCDYDLTGNRSGVCSECGNKIPATMHGILAQRETEMAVTDPG